MNEAIRHWRSAITQPITLIILFTSIVLTTLSGPFGTLQAFDNIQRFFYWAGVILGGVSVSLFIRIGLRLWFPEVVKAWIESATVLAFTIVFGPVLLIWSALFAQIFGSLGYLPSNGMQLLFMALVCGSFLFLRNLTISFIASKAMDRQTIAVAEPPPPVVAPSSRLSKRLPANLQEPILYIAAEGHFVEVHTATGTAKLRMRFKDAINEMEGFEGYCAHRSYWVSRDAIESAEKVNSTWRLWLTNGDEIPVSRKYQPGLEEAGLLGLSAAE